LTLALSRSDLEGTPAAPTSLEAYERGCKVGHKYSCERLEHLRRQQQDRS
jgi:hypothetical protein